MKRITDPKWDNLPPLEEVNRVLKSLLPKAEYAITCDAAAQVWRFELCSHPDDTQRYHCRLSWRGIKNTKDGLREALEPIARGYAQYLRREAAGGGGQPMNQRDVTPYALEREIGVRIESRGLLGPTSIEIRESSSGTQWRIDMHGLDHFYTYYMDQSSPMEVSPRIDRIVEGWRQWCERQVTDGADLPIANTHPGSDPGSIIFKTPIGEGDGSVGPRMGYVKDLPKRSHLRPLPNRPGKFLDVRTQEVVDLNGGLSGIARHPLDAISEACGCAYTWDAAVQAVKDLVFQRANLQAGIDSLIEKKNVDIDTDRVVVHLKAELEKLRCEKLEVQGGAAKEALDQIAEALGYMMTDWLTAVQSVKDLVSHRDSLKACNDRLLTEKRGPSVVAETQEHRHGATISVQSQYDLDED